ncbi:MAG TPA: DUF3618 domain-containing protein [Phenylobacterium sp.]
MTRSSEEIEREVEMTRGDLDRTVEALKERMSAGQIIDELMGSMKGTGASEIVTNLGSQAKDNPLPLALIGAGVAWLMFGKAPRSGREYERRSFVADPYADDATYDPVYDVDTRRYHEDYDPTTGADLSSDGPGLKDKARQAANKVKSAASKLGDVAHDGAAKVSDAVSSAREGLSSAKDSAADRLASARGRTTQGLSSAKYRAGQGYQAAGDRLSSAGGAVRSQASQYGRQAQRTFLETLESEPLIIAAVGIAVGAAVGAAIPASRFENRTVGKLRDKALDQGKDMAQERLAEAKEIAQSALGAVKDEADRQGMPTGVEGLADKVTEVAKAGLDTAKREMEQRRAH